MIQKLTTGPIRWGKHFCIAHIENGQLAEIEGRWVKGQYSVALLHQPAYADTYLQYGITANNAEWKEAVQLLYAHVAELATRCTALPALPQNIVPYTPGRPKAA